MSRINPIIERAKNHKKSSITIGVIAILLAYWGYGKIFVSPASTQYVFAQVKRGTIVTSVTGTGTVSASEDLEIKAQTSGNTTYISNAQIGDAIPAGTLLVQLDGEDAKIALDNAQISLDKLKGDAPDSKSQDAAINDIASALLDLNDISSGLKDLYDFNTGYLGGRNTGNIGQTSDQYIQTAGSELYRAQISLDSLKNLYDGFKRDASSETVKDILTQTYDVMKSFSQTLKDTKIAADYVVNNSATSAAGTTAQANITSWLGKANVDLSTLLADQNSLQSDSLDIRSATLNLEQKEKDYEDTFIRAPWSGVLAKMNVNPGDTVSNGEVVAELISAEKEVNISLNEVDAATVQVGDKASITFDAVSGLTLTGKVTSLDIVGTVSQGVVNYNAKITLDSSDARIKPGMSASATITTATKDNVLTVPVGAIKIQNEASYVQVLKNGVPTNVSVTLGVSNDTDSEVVSGLSEGEKIIIKTIAPSATKTKAPAANTFFGGTRTTSGGAAGSRALGR